MTVGRLLTFALLAAPLPAADELPALLPDTPVTGSITADDATAHTETLDNGRFGRPPRAKMFRLEVDETGPYHIRLRSLRFDAYLVLRDADGLVLAEDDDGLWGTHALLDLPDLDANVPYLVEACALYDRAGPFTLELTRGAAVPLTRDERIAAVIEDAREDVRWHESTDGPVENLPFAFNRLGRALEGAGEYVAAHDAFEQSLALAIDTFGPKHLSTATAHYHLAGAAARIGALDAARENHERGLAIRESELGTDHEEVAASLNNLAHVLSELGEYGAARARYERALAVCETALGPGSALSAAIMNNLAEVLSTLGDLSAARAMLERSAAVVESLYGPDHPTTAGSLLNLASMLSDLGDLHAATPLYRRALEIFESTLGPDHPATLVATNNVAGALAEAGDLEGARGLYARAAESAARVLGPEHSRTAFFTNNLGGVLLDLGDHEGARSAFERALEAIEGRLGDSHPQTASTQRELALLLHGQGEHDAAQDLLDRALATREETFGPGHPDATAVRLDLARLLTDRGDIGAAWSISRRHREESDLAVEHVLDALSEGESFRYLRDRFAQLELRLSLADRLAGDARRSAVTDVYGELLDWKGRIARLVLASRERLALEASPAERALLEELRGYQRRLSSLALMTEIDDPDRHRAELATLRDERNRVELALRRATDTQRPVESITPAALRASLPVRAAVVDLLSHRPYLPATHPTPAASQGAIGEERFSAWITRADRDLVRVDLGPKAALETAVRAFLEELVARRGSSVADVASATEAEPPDPSADLRARIWDPLEPHLDGVETIFLSPDGVLATLPFETLTRPSGEFLIESISFVYTHDVQSIARRRAAATRNFADLLAVGAVDFNRRAAWAPTDSRLMALAATDRTAGGPVLRGGFTDFWAKLPGTEGESQVVADMHEAVFDDDGTRTLLQGPEPTEERLKHELSRHSVLHLATHGFFQPEGTASMWETVRNERGGREVRLNADADALLVRHPGLLSGLVCAGANRGPSDGGDEEGDDGYLTAEEVGWLDLTDVELVVLSACETGLGRSQSGEGLIGLRRAFLTAGAETVISSLWSVKDDTTAALMQGFYKNLFLKGMPRHEALRAAQLRMLNQNLARDGRPLPSTWGAFILSGEWR